MQLPPIGDIGHHPGFRGKLTFQSLGERTIIKMIVRTYPQDSVHGAPEQMKAKKADEKQEAPPFESWDPGAKSSGPKDQVGHQQGQKPAGLHLFDIRRNKEQQQYGKLAKEQMEDPGPFPPFHGMWVF